ncbi:MAG: hypothetical protein JXD22_00875 [Sedimentisphaerales bacterium]|nr:hypothetical protein [Sedimentisphaerales bacterium]
MTIHLCGAGLGFLGFAISMIIGLVVNNPFTTLVLRSLFVLLVFYIMGCFLAFLGNLIIKENFEQLNPDNATDVDQPQTEAVSDNSTTQSSTPAAAAAT